MCFLEVVFLFLDLLWNIIYQNVQNRIPYRMVSIAMYLSKMGIFFLVSEFLKDEYLIQVAEWEPNRHNINCSYHMIKYCGENFIWISWDVFEKMLFRGSKNVFFACLQIDDVPSCTYFVSQGVSIGKWFSVSFDQAIQHTHKHVISKCSKWNSL